MYSDLPGTQDLNLGNILISSSTKTEVKVKYTVAVLVKM